MTRRFVVSTLLILAIFLFPAERPVIAGTEQHSPYAKIRINVPDNAAFEQLARIGIDLESAAGRPGGAMEFITSAYERAALTKAGVAFAVVVPDVEAEARKGLKRIPAGATGFGTGSMGGYYTYDEVIRQLDSMKFQYPDIITAKFSIGRSIEGRNLWMVKIGRNPDVHDTTKPEVLYTALHHAREPGGMMSVLYFMWWLLEKYSTDPTAAYLVNNRQMYFLPVVNPDGYLYNQMTNPGGGGGWRKNRRNNGDGTWGVDLNRNYGPFPMWNSSNNGSSPDPFMDTYRGPGPFSEPETAALDTFLRAHRVATCLNYHTFGNYLIYPFGYSNRETTDSTTFREFAFDMTAINRYQSGTDQQTVNYGTRGGSDDYMYGDNSKPKTYAMTPEAGWSFWDETDLIVPTARENLHMNIYNALFAGQYTIGTRFEAVDNGGNNNGYPDRGEPVSIIFHLRNKGLAPAANLTCSVSGAGGTILWQDTAKTIAALDARTNGTVQFTGTVKPDASTGRPYDLILTISDPNGYRHSDTMTFVPGTPTIVFADSAEEGSDRWDPGTGWSVTTESHSGLISFVDSPSGSYPPECDNALSLMAPLNLTQFDHVYLKFWTRWAIEPRFDFGRVEVTTDGGAVWTSLPSSLSRPGSNVGMQEGGSVGYDGYSPGSDWIEISSDLTPYRETQTTIQFRVLSDGARQRDGWYLDDIQILGYKESVLGVGGETNLLPVADRLGKNYPNPFNPATSIDVDMARAGRLTVTVFDVLGKQIATIIDHDVAAGSHRLTFDARQLSSGIYFYRMTAHHADGSVFTGTEKMVLTR